MKISRTKKAKKVLVALTAALQLGMVLTPQPSTVNAAPARQMEKLDRGVVAVKVTNGVFVSWRLFGTDPSGTAFNVYRNGTKVNGSPITGGTNYVDAGGTTGSTYTVKPVIGGQEQASSQTAVVWGQNYLQVPISPPSGTHVANDCSTGDLDGDGEYDIVVKWDPPDAKDNSQAGTTGLVYLDGYKLNGTRLFRINLGKNIRAGAHYTQFLVYDFDGNGKSEVVCKTADGTVDGKGKVIGDASKDYRNGDGYILSGPEYLTVFSGQTGEALATANYDPPRGNVGGWGDTYGNRVDRFLACVAYLDGVHPSIVMQRGYYTRMVVAAWDFRDGNLTKRWTYDSNSATPSLAGQGNHNLSVGDVDGDGKDEIMQGASAIDDNGKAMYSTRLGHGDAMHFGDLNPDRPGLELWTCHEGSGGADLHDARTGEILFRWNASGDTGRACTADVVASSPGEEMWASGSPLFSSTGKNLGSAPGSVNFAIWWDGDELRELLNGTSITKHGGGTLLSASGCASNNSTKSTPALTADILGDWREEAIWRTSDNKALRIYTTTNTTNRRIYTLMHDPLYRLSVAWQNAAYNQPTHTGFFIGAGMKEPPVPGIYLTGTNPQTPPPTTPPPTNTPTPINTPIPGAPEDLNGDKVVNMADIMMVAAYFNAPVTDNNRKFDLTKDGAINMADIMQVASKFNLVLASAPDVYEAEQGTVSDDIQNVPMPNSPEEDILKVEEDM